MKIPVIYIVGSGNLAWHLSEGLRSAGFQIKGIIARNQREGKKLSAVSACEYFKTIPDNIDIPSLLFLCVSDDAIDELVEIIPNKKITLVHCSGMHPLLSASGHADQRKYGVLYPVQSFNKKLKVSWNTIPVCIEAGDESTRKLLHAIARKIAGKVYRMDSADRAYVHLAAVFANNFSNALFAISQEVLQLRGIEFDILRPLILQTSLKVQDSRPDTVQTGPALRSDLKTIRAHKKLLRETPEPGKIYNDLTRFIQHHFKKR